MVEKRMEASEAQLTAIQDSLNKLLAERGKADATFGGTLAASQVVAAMGPWTAG